MPFSNIHTERFVFIRTSHADQIYHPGHLEFQRHRRGLSDLKLFDFLHSFYSVFLRSFAL